MYKEYISGIGECYVISQDEFNYIRNVVLFTGHAEYGGYLVQCYTLMDDDIDYAVITDIPYPA